MKYIAEFDELKNQFNINFLDEDGNLLTYIGAAPDKASAKDMVADHVRKRKAAKKAIEFDDDGKVTKDGTVS